MKLDPKVIEEMRAIAAGEGFELLGVEVTGTGARTLVRLVIDGPNGVNLDQCAAISRQASAFLDVEDPLKHRYTLEVSSPGLDRKLYSEDDFDRYAGRRVTIRMAPTHRGSRTVVGELLGLEENTVRVAAEGGEVLKLPFAEVFEARLQVDWDEVMKKGNSRR